jgi:hypothetical protein
MAQLEYPRHPARMHIAYLFWAMAMRASSWLQATMTSGSGGAA